MPILFYFNGADIKLKIQELIEKELSVHGYSSFYNNIVDNWTIWRPESNVFVSIFYDMQIKKFCVRTGITVSDDAEHVHKMSEELRIAANIINAINTLRASAQSDA